jgi:hypothetical protein
MVGRLEVSNFETNVLCTKIFQVPKVTGRVIWLSGVDDNPGITP